MAQRPRYFCWREHREDLTSIVEDLVKHQHVVIMKLSDERQAPPPSRVLATCSEGHENIFTLGGGIGTPPTPADKIWTDTLDVLTPVAGLQAIEKHAQFIFSAVAFLATLLTGFGIASDFKVPLSRLWLVAFPVTLLALSLAVTVFAMTPTVTMLRALDLAEVERLVNERLKSGGRAIRLAGLILSLAFLSVIPIYSVLVRPVRGVSVRPSFRFVRQANSSTLTFHAQVLGLHSDARGELLLVARNDGSQRILLKQTVISGEDGSFESTVEIPDAQTFQRFDVRTTIHQLEDEIRYDATFAPPSVEAANAGGVAAER